jgi:hypothetical protein
MDNSGNNIITTTTTTTAADIAMPPSLAIILLGVILLDSINMLPEAGKGTNRDRDAIQLLLDRTDWTVPLSPTTSSLPDTIMDPTGQRPDLTRFFDCLQSQKFSPIFWNGLTTLQALRMDYKSFPISLSTSSSRGNNNNNIDKRTNTAFGVSTILLDMDTFWKTKGDIEKSMYHEMKEKNIILLGVMFTFMEENHHQDDDDDDDTNDQSSNNNTDDDGSTQPTSRLRRQLALACTKKDILEEVLDYLFNDQNAKSTLELDQEGIIESKMGMSLGDSPDGGTSDNEDGSTMYIARMNQGNVASSRKQVAPVLMGFWKNR